MTAGGSGRPPAAPVGLGELPALGSRTAVIEPGRGRIGYADLDRLADGVAARLLERGLQDGARVGLYLRRSIDAVAAILGILRAGCTWVPVDPHGPAARNVGILADCDVRATLIEAPLAEACRTAAPSGRPAGELLVVGPAGAGEAVGAWVSDRPEARRGACGDVACVLTTSGSTGRPKGWLMTRAAIEAHARWSRGLLSPGPGDAFANHAPFSFGMSLFDVFSSLGSGAALVLVPDSARPIAARVLDVLEGERVTIVFASPAILERIAAVGDLARRDLGALRAVAFAGQVFAAPALAALRRSLPHPRLFNFYGSTETNVAAWHEIPSGAGPDGPVPIGRPCPHFEARVAGLDGGAPAPGGVGELQLRGVGLSAGYLGLPQIEAERLVPASDGGQPWHRTGDLVRELEGGELLYAGRIGRMVKLRGHRVEPGEVEARLQCHPRIAEVAVVPAEGPGGLQLVAHVGGPRLPVVELKAFCAVKLPAYMIPERFEFHDALPRNPRGKIDYAALGGR